MKTVLQKHISDSGLCSRRAAEDLIKKGKVMVNKKKAELGMRVDGDDVVEVDGKKITGKGDNIYIILNKPKGYVCSNRIFPGEKNIFSLIGTKERLFVAGRLDKDSEGLVLLTNDGTLVQELTHPKFEHRKKYLVSVTGDIDKEKIKKSFEQGFNIPGETGKYRAKELKEIKKGMFEVTLTEGKKRQIRKMFSACGTKVKSLKRVSLGKLKLGQLSPGKYKIINKNDII